jgi:hypothetical protein
MGGGPPFSSGADPSGPYRTPRGDSGGRNFGPNKPPKGRGGAAFSKKRQQEGQARGPLKERLSGRMFSVEEDSRFKDEDDTGVDIDVNLKDEVSTEEEE